MRINSASSLRIVFNARRRLEGPIVRTKSADSNNIRRTHGSLLLSNTVQHSAVGPANIGAHMQRFFHRIEVSMKVIFFNDKNQRLTVSPIIDANNI